MTGMDDLLEQELIDRFTLSTFMEAARLYEEGVASAQSIDIAMRAGAGLPLGPLAWADQVGLDVVSEKLSRLQATFGERFSPPQSLRDRIERGQLGVKSGAGYFMYAF